MLLQEILHNAAREAPDEVALVFESQSWSFRELEQRVSHLAAVLRDLTAPGDRIAVLSENLPAVVELYYAVPEAGRCLVLLNYRLGPRELAHTLANAGASLLIGERALLDPLAPHADVFPDLHTTVSLDEATPGERTWEQLLQHEPRAESPTDASENDPAWLIYTSGTTGRPKGAVLTHRNLVTAVLSSSLGRPVHAGDVYLYPFPLCHVSGHNVLVYHLHRRPAVLLRRFTPEAVIAAVEQHGVTTLSLAPTMIGMLLDAPDLASADLSSLRSIGYGASAIPPELLRRAIERLGCDFAQGYGMTEMAGNGVYLDAAAHRRGLEDAPQLLRAAGRPGPLVAVRVVDEAGRDVAPGESGEVVVRGDQVSPGYWRDPEGTQACLRDGWWHTGDVGQRDAEGFLYIIDRKKDIIVSGGENISSREVEDVLHVHPAVREAAVIGVPDAKWGEAVCAVVVLRDGEHATPAELVDLVRDHLAGYKKPRHVLFVDALPRNPSGKVLKQELRAHARRVLEP
jgi:acyl-CoA synthetase (AMP-forming)/AMP-acid ligase II